MKKQKINTNSSGKYTHYVRDKSDKFTITEDKLRLKLNGLKKSLENKNSLFCYLGVSVAIIISLLTNDFNDFLINRNLWKAIFIVFLLIMIYSFIINLYHFLINKKGVDDVIKDIKKEQR